MGCVMDTDTSIKTQSSPSELSMLYKAVCNKLHNSLCVSLHIVFILLIKCLILEMTAN